MHIQQPFKWLQPLLVSFLEVGDEQLVCNFTGSSRATTQRWAANTNPAKGGNEIRLWQFLLAAGYESPELRIPEFNQYLAELYAHSIITIGDAASLAGVTDEQTALRIMRGQPPMHPTALEEIKSTFGEQLRDAQRDLQQKLRVVGATTLPSLPEASAEVLAEAPAFDVLVPVLAAMVEGLTPLAQQAVESWTPAQRSRLRELAGDSLFELANSTYNLSQILSALNSERARSQHIEGM